MLRVLLCLSAHAFVEQQLTATRLTLIVILNVLNRRKTYLITLKLIYFARELHQLLESQDVSCLNQQPYIRKNLINILPCTFNKL